MRSISCWTSALFELDGLEDELAPELVVKATLFLAGLDSERLPVPGVLSAERLAWDKSAVTRVIMIRFSNRCFRKSKMAFCIMSVTSKPLSDGPTMTTGRIDGTTSYTGTLPTFLLKKFFFCLAEVDGVLEPLPVALFSWPDVFVLFKLSLSSLASPLAATLFSWSLSRLDIDAVALLFLSDCCICCTGLFLPSLAFLSVLWILIASSLSGLGINPHSQPSLTSRPIHQSLFQIGHFGTKMHQNKLSHLPDFIK
ncbi:hypothetical protein BpHYR1_021650 [Brachionus plicatilis]|uniref:Uncharacterized protein n=1 Tax=Brachionus plicatilis TaxID=10195 RepID=A0A3M7RUU7_BRAPC|nr:hypothetical protein BpHYR1_021650 [Brachionus plicatilis]